MNLMEQENNEKDKKVKKIILTSLIIVVVIFFIVLAVMLYCSYQESKQLKLYVDKTRTAIKDDLLVFDNTSNKIYLSIKEMASIAGYEYYNGDYKNLTEEQNKCYLNNKKEVAGFELGSNQLYKTDPTENTQDYDWYTLDEPVKIINGELYASSSAIELACNVSFTYNQEKNRIEIMTLPYLVSAYQAIVINNYGYAGLDEAYQNQKAILYNMLVIKKQEDKKTFKYGVISLDNKQIIGTKYDAIKFMEISSDFFVTTDKKVGILSSEGAQKIEPSYDEIKILDNDSRLYYVKNNKLAGVLDKNGNRVVYLEYEKIGVTSSSFPSNDIKNSMLLFENCIPVMKNNKWGVFDKEGNLIIDTVYDGLGYIGSTKKDNAVNNLLIIPSIEGIVVCQNEKYGIINSRGKFVAPVSFDRIYSVTNLGSDKVYLEYGDQTIELEDYLKLNGQSTGSTEDADTNNTVDTTNTTVDNTNVVENSTVDTNVMVNQ